MFSPSIATMASVKVPDDLLLGNPNATDAGDVQVLRDARFDDTDRRDYAAAPVRVALSCEVPEVGPGR